MKFNKIQWLKNINCASLIGILGVIVTLPQTYGFVGFYFWKNIVPFFVLPLILSFGAMVAFDLFWGKEKKGFDLTKAIVVSLELGVMYAALDYLNKTDILHLGGFAVGTLLGLATLLLYDTIAYFRAKKRRR